MASVAEHRAALVHLDDWEPYLTAHSNLPGPRSNLELIWAVAEEADARRAKALVASGDEYLQCCGLVAMGRLLGEGRSSYTKTLHGFASDDRWRIRECVAMALQRAGDTDLEVCFGLAETWAHDPDPLVRRAAVAAVCEPRLLEERSFAHRALVLLAAVTRDPESRTLRQALGYAWSVAIAALPDEGLRAFARLEQSDDPDVQWIVRENRKKKRLKRLLGE